MSGGVTFQNYLDISHLPFANAAKYQNQTMHPKVWIQELLEVEATRGRLTDKIWDAWFNRNLK